MFTNLKKKDYIGIAKLLVTRQFSSSTTNKDRNINEMNFNKAKISNWPEANQLATVNSL